MKLRCFYKIRHYSTFKNSGNPLSVDSQILNLCKSGSLSEALKILNATDCTKIGVKPLVYASLIQTSVRVESFRHGLQFHSHVFKTGLAADRFVGNSLLSLYFKQGRNVAETRKLFDGLVYRDAISWTTMIIGYVRAGKPMRSVEVFKEMLRFGVEPSAFSLSAVVKACAELEAIRLGECAHGVVMKYGLGFDQVISSGLIDMYGRSNAWLDALMVFDEMSEPDAFCWSSVIAALTRNDMYEEALCLFSAMQRENGMWPDTFTYGPVLTACGNLGRLKLGKQVHGKAITFGICKNVIVESSLVDMYGKCGLVDKSRRVFDGMKERNAVSWCALLGSYCHAGDFKSVIELSRVMEVINLYSFGTILRACAGLTNIRQGKEVHCLYLRKGGQTQVIVESALVDLYAKCGYIDQAEKIFGQMTARNTITWNSMICGYAQNGRGEKSLKMFNRMVAEGIKPDNISFIGVLFACSHAGLVDLGREYFRTMSEMYGIKPHAEHYSCMIDLLGRAGFQEEAESLLMNSNMEDESSLWSALLGSCTSCTDPDTAVRIAKKMMDLDPAYHVSYVYLANVYKAMGQWNEALRILDLMKERGINKTCGMSWIDIDKEIHMNAKSATF